MRGAIREIAIWKWSTLERVLKAKMWKICLFLRFIPSLEGWRMIKTPLRCTRARQGYPTLCCALHSLDFEAPCSTGEGNHAMRHWQPTVFVRYFNGIPWKCIEQCAVSTTVTAIGYTSAKTGTIRLFQSIHSTTKQLVREGEISSLNEAIHTKTNDPNTHCLASFVLFSFSTFFSVHTHRKKELTVNGFGNASFKMWF